ncbi:MAG: hypothetical protein ABIC82_06640 [bacterium]
MSNNNKKLKSKSNLKPRCGLCGSTRKKLTKTECCGNWICNDENNYVLFSYARNSCARNHRRFTLCGYHHTEGHKGDWKTCKKCLKDFEHNLEMYVWYGTNEYNFEKLENPPDFKPTYCYKCGERIVLPDGGYSSLCGVYCCDECEITEEDRKKIIREYDKKNK